MGEMHDIDVPAGSEFDEFDVAAHVPEPAVPAATDGPAENLPIDPVVDLTTAAEGRTAATVGAAGDAEDVDAG